MEGLEVQPDYARFEKADFIVINIDYPVELPLAERARTQILDTYKDWDKRFKVLFCSGSICEKGGELPIGMSLWNRSW